MAAGLVYATNMDDLEIELLTERIHLMKQKLEILEQMKEMQQYPLMVQEGGHDHAMEVVTPIQESISQAEGEALKQTFDVRRSRIIFEHSRMQAEL